MSGSRDTRPVGDFGRSGSYDPARRRRTVRRGREKGCWLYVAADELVAAGYDPDDPPPWYRVWGTPRGGMFKLYREG